MFTRNLLLILGSLSIVLGLVVAYASLKQTAPEPVQTVTVVTAPKTQVLVAAHAIAMGTLLQSSARGIWRVARSTMPNISAPSHGAILPRARR
jgi:Flp pilus assembly protein CpaB